ncbi:hypothetical protein [Paraburkholderia hiiakae]|uniref:hypothetical protein n=1 Tax=Paraburkholderia hiiakae TaxID=1081782 RepID=UPI00191B2FB3|nr:hypothetical protein [Paraburkholderia hiiakae]
MPLTAPDSGRARSAEAEYRAAFERLKKGKPERLPLSMPVSQNNVAREAGCDPSALKKSRFPALIAEIQQYLVEHGGEKPASARQTKLAQRKKTRSLRERIEAIARQRDQAVSMLNEANLTILELVDRVAELEAKLPPDNVRPLRQR